MNWFKKYYGKDTFAKIGAGFITVFLAVGLYLQPNWWPYIAGIFVGYVALFYFKRNTP